MAGSAHSSTGQHHGVFACSLLDAGLDMQTVLGPMYGRARAGMATYTCHSPRHVFDVVPADVCAAVILATGAALTQV